MATYVALRRIKVGAEHLMPGEELPELEENRNLNLLLRQGLIANLDVQAASDEEQQQALDVSRARVEQLEGLLAAAQRELSEVRGKLADGGEDESAVRISELEAIVGERDAEIARLTGASAAQEGSEIPLEQMTKAQLVEHAQATGVAVDPTATKARIIEVHRAATEGPGE